MFSKCLVKQLGSKFEFIAPYSTSTTSSLTKSSAKALVTSLFKRKDDKKSEVKYSLAKAADFEPTVEFMDKNFFYDDPLSRSLCIGSKRDKGPLLPYLRSGLDHGVSIIARDGDEIIGACINSKNCPWDAQKLEEYAKSTNDEDIKKLMYIWSLIIREPRLHQELGVSSIFEVGILSVDKKVGNRGIGTELFKRSLDLARDLNFSYARATCTSEFSAKIAEKLNMKRVWDVSFKNILTQDGKCPLVVPEYPHSQASSYYIYLKEQIDEENFSK